MTLTSANFTQAGTAGTLAQNFITQGTQLYFGLAQGAAAFTAGSPTQALAAVSDLESELRTYNATVSSFANVVAQTNLATLADLPGERSSFAAAVAAAQAAATTLGGAQGASIIAAPNRATSSFNSAQADVSGLNLPSSFVGGTNPAFSVLTLSQFQDIRSDTAQIGVADLPPQEVTMADTLLQMAGRSAVGMPGTGPEIAYFDGMGDRRGIESALFAADGGQMDVSQILAASATTLFDRIVAQHRPGTVALDADVQGERSRAPIDRHARPGGLLRMARNYWCPRSLIRVTLGIAPEEPGQEVALPPPPPGKCPGLSD